MTSYEPWSSALGVHSTGPQWPGVPAAASFWCILRFVLISILDTDTGCSWMHPPESSAHLQSRSHLHPTGEDRELLSEATHPGCPFTRWQNQDSTHPTSAHSTIPASSQMLPNLIVKISFLPNTSRPLWQVSTLPGQPTDPQYPYRNGLIQRIEAKCHVSHFCSMALLLSHPYHGIFTETGFTFPPS